MTTEPNSALLRLFLSFVALACGAGAIIIAAVLVVNVLA